MSFLNTMGEMLQFFGGGSKPTEEERDEAKLQEYIDTRDSSDIAHDLDREAETPYTEGGD